MNRNTDLLSMPVTTRVSAATRNSQVFQPDGSVGMSDQIAVGSQDTNAVFGTIEVRSYAHNNTNTNNPNNPTHDNYQNPPIEQIDRTANNQNFATIPIQVTSEL